MCGGVCDNNNNMCHHDTPLHTRQHHIHTTTTTSTPRAAVTVAVVTATMRVVAVDAAIISQPNQATQTRTIKQSGHWYKSLIAAHKAGKS